MKNRILIIIIGLIFSSCQKTDNPLTFDGLKYIVDELNKSATEDLMLKNGYSFEGLSQYDEDRPTSFVPERLVYKKNKYNFEVAFIGNTAYQIKLVTLDSETYIKIKESVKNGDYKIIDSEMAEETVFEDKNSIYYIRFYQTKNETENVYVVDISNLKRRVVGIDNYEDMEREKWKRENVK